MSLQKKPGKRKPGNVHVMAITVCLLVIAGLLFDWWSDRQTWHLRQTSTPAVQAESDLPGKGGEQSDPDRDPEQPDNTDTPADLIPVYLVGAVRRPGIYHIEPGSYLYQLVEQAGGLSENAAADQINLVLRLDHNQQIFIPTIEDLAENPALLHQQSQQQDKNPLVDLNKAGQADLEKLPGIGPVTAKAILDFRDKNGPFNAPEDIMLVPGIKESRFAALEDYIMVSAPPK